MGEIRIKDAVQTLRGNSCYVINTDLDNPLASSIVLTQEQLQAVYPNARAKVNDTIVDSWGRVYIVSKVENTNYTLSNTQQMIGGVTRPS